MLLTRHAEEVEVAKYTSRLKGLISRMVLDEAVLVKNDDSKNHAAVALAKADHYWAVTATPMANHVRDLHGYLKLFYDPLWNTQTEVSAETLYDDDIDRSQLIWGSQGRVYDELSPQDKKRYRDSASPQHHALSQAIDDGYDVFVLNPAVYKTFAWCKSPSIELIRKSHQKILQLLMFKHTLDSSIDMGPSRTSIQIGDDVPHMEVSTIEVRNSRGDQELYEARYENLSEHLYSRVGSGGHGDGPSARINADKHQTLKYNTLNLHLGTLADSAIFKKRPSGSEIATWHSQYPKNHGGSFLFRATRPAKYLAEPANNIALLDYILGPSPKHKLLAYELGIRCYEQGKRVIIVVRLPC